MIYQVRRYDPLQLVNHGFAITLLVNLRGRGMALRTPQSQQNIIQARDRFTGVGASGVECQSAFKFDPASASNFDPFGRRVLAVALAPSELVGVAETVRARAA